MKVAIPWGPGIPWGPRMVGPIHPRVRLQLAKAASGGLVSIHPRVFCFFFILAAAKRDEPMMVLEAVEEERVGLLLKPKSDRHGADRHGADRHGGLLHAGDR